MRGCSRQSRPIRSCFLYGIAATWRALPLAAGLALWIPFASSVAIAAIIFSFFAIFPRRILVSRGAWLAVWLPMAPVLWLQIRFTAYAVYQPADPRPFVDWNAATTVVTALYAVAALAALMVSYRHLTDVTEQRRLRVIVLGSVTGLLGVLPVVARTGSVRIPRSEIRCSLAVGRAWCDSGARAAGILRVCHAAPSPVRCGAILLAGIAYALARRVLISIVPAMAVLLAADLWMHREITLVDLLRGRGWVYAGLAAFAVFARLQRDNWLDALDRRFFRERYRVERLLREINDDVRSAASVDLAAARTVAAVEASLHPEFVGLQLRQPEEALYRIAAIAPPRLNSNRWSLQARSLVCSNGCRSRFSSTPRTEPDCFASFLPEKLQWLRRSRVRATGAAAIDAGGRCRRRGAGARVEALGRAIQH